MINRCEVRHIDDKEKNKHFIITMLIDLLQGTRQTQHTQHTHTRNTHTNTTRIAFVVEQFGNNEYKSPEALLMHDVEQ